MRRRVSTLSDSIAFCGIACEGVYDDETAGKAVLRIGKDISGRLLSLRAGSCVVRTQQRAMQRARRRSDMCVVCCGKSAIGRGARGHGGANFAQTSCAHAFARNLLYHSFFTSPHRSSSTFFLACSSSHLIIFTPPCLLHNARTGVYHHNTGHVSLSNRNIGISSNPSTTPCLHANSSRTHRSKNGPDAIHCTTHRNRFPYHKRDRRLRDVKSRRHWKMRC